MKRWVMVVVAVVALGAFGLGLIAARAIQVVSYESGRLHTDVEWYRHVDDIEAQLARGETAIVGDYRVSVDRGPKKAGRKILKARRVSGKAAPAMGGN